LIESECKHHRLELLVLILDRRDLL